MEINVISGALYTQDGKKIADVTVTFLILRPALVTGGRGCYMS